MRHPVSQELFAYWDALRAGRAAPERSALDPAAIRDLLAYTFLLETGAPDAAGSRAVSFRLSGTRLNALFRRELKGGAFAALWAKNDEAEAAALVEGVLDDCAPAVAGVRGCPKDYEPVDFELLLLPLRHHGRTHARLLGSIVAEVAPTWIGLRPIEGLRLASFRTILPRDAGRLGTFGGLVPVTAPPRLLSGVAWVLPRNSASPSRRDEPDGVGEPTPSCLAPSPGPASSTPMAVGARTWPFKVHQGGRDGQAPVSTVTTADFR